MTAFLKMIVSYCSRSLWCDGSIPCHDIVANRRSRDTSRRISLHALEHVSSIIPSLTLSVIACLEVTHQTAACSCRHLGVLVG